MKVYFKDLPKDIQKEVKGILNGNGMKVSDTIIHRDGNKFALEVKKTGQIVTVN